MTDDQDNVARYPHTTRQGLPLGPFLCFLLAVAFGVLGVTLGGLHAAGIITVRMGVFPLIGAGVTSAFVSGVLLTCAAGLHRRLDRIERQFVDQRQEGYAEGYVAAASGGRHLTAVNRG